MEGIMSKCLWPSNNSISISHGISWLEPQKNVTHMIYTLYDDVHMIYDNTSQCIHSAYTYQQDIICELQETLHMRKGFLSNAVGNA